MTCLHIQLFSQALQISDRAAHFRAASQRHRAIFKEAFMANGTVKWFNPIKGFGFIQPADGSGDVFVHISAVEKAGLRNLNEGQSITYQLVNERGKNAAVDLSTV